MRNALTAAFLLLAAGCGGGEEAAPLQLPPEGRWFGFSGNTALAERGGVAPARAVADARAVGANAARIQVGWWNLEPERGRIDRGYLARVRRFVKGFERTGGRVLIVLGVAPPWASQKPGDARAAPAAGALRDYERYARRVARLFPTALAIETWNEPNSKFFWAPGKPDAGLYASMHRRAAKAIRAEAPDTKVLLGGIVAVPVEGDVVTPATYMRAMYDAGLTPDDSDGAGVHIYPGEEGGRMKPLDGDGFQGKLSNLRRAFEGEPRWWVTETGVTTSGPNPASASAQANGVVALLEELFGMDEVDAVFVHTQYETPAAAADPERGYGVLRGRGKAKPAFCAMRRRAARPPADRRCARG